MKLVGPYRQQQLGRDQSWDSGDPPDVVGFGRVSESGGQTWTSV